MTPLSRGAGLGWAPRGRRTALVLDADRTLAPVDTGRQVGALLGLNTRIREMFEDSGYTVEAFSRHAEIWSAVPRGAYLEAIDEVGQSVQLYDAWLRVIAGAPDVPKVVVTAGIPQLWRCVLDRYGFHDVPVLGGLHAAMDESFVTPQCKAWIVRELRGAGFRVVAAGDSEIDLEMLSAADLGLFVADTKGSPRLLRRISEVRGVHHFATDSRRFPPLPTIDGHELLERLLKD